MRTTTVTHAQWLPKPMARIRVMPTLKNTQFRALAMVPAFIVICWWAVPILHADDTLVLLPTEIKLAGSQAYQTLLVEESRNGQYVGQLTDGVTFESSN